MFNRRKQKDFQGASSPELATSSLTWLVAWLVMKLLRFVAEAKKLSNHHRTPIFFSIMGPWLQDLTSLKRPSAHKSFGGYKKHITKETPLINQNYFCCNFELTSILKPNHGFSHWHRSEREGNSGSLALSTI